MDREGLKRPHQVSLTLEFHGGALWSGWARHRCMCIPYSHRNTSLLAGVSKKTVHKAREEKLQLSDYITTMKDGSHKADAGSKS